MKSLSSISYGSSSRHWCYHGWRSNCKYTQLKFKLQAQRFTADCFASFFFMLAVLACNVLPQSAWLNIALTCHTWRVREKMFWIHPTTSLHSALDSVYDGLIILWQFEVPDKVSASNLWRTKIFPSFHSVLEPLTGSDSKSVTGITI